MTYSLRPVEWYNLARKFGKAQFLLHDDFYTDDGEAMQPTLEVMDAERFPVPSLSSLSEDINCLLDYCYPKSGLSEKILEKWRTFPAELAVQFLTDRLLNDQRSGIADVVLNIARGAFKSNANGLCRLSWNFADTNRIGKHTLIRASIECLPHTEAFSLVTGDIERDLSKRGVHLLFSLADFQSSESY